MWNKHGIIYSDKKAQLPVLEERNCSWRIYFTSRNKLNQNEELAELRADTSLTKTQMGIDSKRQSDIFKQRDVSILKGPRR